MRVYASLLLFVYLFSWTTTVHGAEASSWNWTTPSKGTLTVQESVPQSADTQTLPTLRISEVFPNPKGADTNNEWIELYNPESTPISLSGVYLRNSRGQTFPLPETEIVAPQTYHHLPLPSSWSLKNTEDTITLHWGEEVLDTVIYGEIEEGLSLSRFCSQTAPLHCTLEPSPPTPGAANTMLPLTVTPSHTGGELSTPLTLSFTGSHPGMKIFYSMNPTSKNPEDMIEYHTPLTIEGTTTLGFFGVYEDRSSAIEYLSFHLPGEAPHTAETAYISELTKDSIEVFTPQKTELFITSSPNCTEHCQAISTSPGFSTHTLTFPTAEATSMYLLSTDHILLDTLELPPTINTSWSRMPQDSIQYLRRSFYTSMKQHPLNSFVETLFQTPHQTNLFMWLESPDRDQDRDGLSDESERETYGSNATQRDTDGDLLPDNFEIKYHLSPTSSNTGELYDVFRTLYKQELLSLLTFSIQDHSIAGRSIPHAHISIFDSNSPNQISSTTADTYGHFDLPFASTPSHIIIKDPSGISTDPMPLTRWQTSQALHTTQYTTKEETYPPFFLSALPNPPGKDTASSEWIVLQYNGSTPYVFSDYVLEHQKHQRILPTLELYPGDLLLLTGEELEFSLVNTNGSIRLLHQDTLLLDLTYNTAEEGTLRTTQEQSNPSSTAPSSPHGSTASPIGSRASLSVPYQPLTPLLLPTLEQLPNWEATATQPFQLHWYTSTALALLGALGLLYQDTLKTLWAKREAWYISRKLSILSTASTAYSSRS